MVIKPFLNFFVILKARPRSLASFSAKLKFSRKPFEPKPELNEAAAVAKKKHLSRFAELSEKSFGFDRNKMKKMFFDGNELYRDFKIGRTDSTKLYQLVNSVFLAPVVIPRVQLNL